MLSFIYYLFLWDSPFYPNAFFELIFFFLKKKFVYFRTGKVSGLKIGQFALNVVNFPVIKPDNDVTPSSNNKLEPRNIASKLVFELVEKLVYHCVGIPLSIDLLNNTRFMPKSENENLQAGLLQLTDGTAVILDETGITEGTLGDLGKNIT